MYKSTNWINIRPMYIKDNIIKSDKIDPTDQGKLFHEIK